jgi:hypothetical protein
MEEEFEDAKGVIRIRISMKNRQYNGQKEKVQKDKQRSTKYTCKTKDRVTRTPLKTGGELYRTAYFSRKNTSLTLIHFIQTPLKTGGELYRTAYFSRKNTSLT